MVWYSIRTETRCLRLGNAVDPFGAIEKFGSDPLRWYMITALLHGTT